MTFRFEPAKGLIIVPARIWGSERDSIVRLALDTGATRSMVSTAVLVALGYDPAAATDRVRVTTASGVEFAASIQIASLEVLGRRRQSFPLLAHTLPPSASVDGPLGLDFFRGRCLTADFGRGLLTLD